MMCPDPCSRIEGRTAAIPCSTPRRFTSIIWFQSSTRRPSTSDSGITPALLTRTSTRPWRTSASATSLHIFKVGDVQLRVLGVVAGVLELGDKLGEAVNASGTEDDVVSGGSEMAGGGLTDAAGRASHQDDLLLLSIVLHGFSLSDELHRPFWPETDTIQSTTGADAAAEPT